jgi:hypothetical protein
MAGWVLASNQVYMYVYLLPYLILLWRPKLFRVYKRVGAILPVYLLLGIINGVINIYLISQEKTKDNSYKTVAGFSSYVVIILCALTIVLAYLMYIKVSLRGDGKVGAEG